MPQKNESACVCGFANNGDISPETTLSSPQPLSAQNFDITENDTKIYASSVVKRSFRVAPLFRTVILQQGPAWRCRVNPPPPQKNVGEDNPSFIFWICTVYSLDRGKKNAVKSSVVIWPSRLLLCISVPRRPTWKIRMWSLQKQHKYCYDSKWF